MSQHQPSDLLHINALYDSFEAPSADGSRLFIQVWKPSDTAIQAHLVVLHGYCEHGGRYREFAQAMTQYGIATWAIDLRGHGRSAGARGFVARFDDYLDDLDVAMQTAAHAPIFLLGHSCGGLIALDYVAQRCKQHDKLQGLIVTNPFLALSTPPPRIKQWVGKWAGQFLPKLSLPNGLQANMLTHDPHEIVAHQRDPLIFHTANAGWFREVEIAQQRVLIQHHIHTDVLYIYSDQDPIASTQVNRHMAKNIKSPHKKIIERKGEYHEVLHETHRHELYTSIGQWISKT